jgi:membrane-associated phospholipid phosphatase
MNNYLSALGYQGPNIILLLIIIAFYQKNPSTSPYLYIAIVVWQVASHLLNVVIKNYLKLPRPDSDMDVHHKLTQSITWKNYLIIHRNFGMPSGHAQAVISELTFLALYFKNPWLTTIATLQAALTLYQRYYKRRHSIKQLLAGSLLGVVVGTGFYTGLKYYKMKSIL